MRCLTLLREGILTMHSNVLPLGLEINRIRLNVIIFILF